MDKRCDSVDALMYAYYEFMRNKEENQMLEKNKDYFEFSLHSMVATHRPYQEDTEIAITGMIPGREILGADNPFDIPCDVVMIPKREFDQLQASNEWQAKRIKHYRELAEQWEKNYTALLDTADHHRELAKQWEEKYNLLLEKTGFDTVESLIFYLTNIVQCDTLQETIASLQGMLQCVREEWKDMKKKLEECEKDYISERDKAEALEKEIGIYSRTLNEWKEGTGCPSPSASKTLIESGASWMSAYHSSCEVIKTWKKLTGCPTPIAAKTLIESGMSYEHGYHEVQEENRKLTEEVESWQNVTGYATPEDYLAAKIHTVYVKLEPSNVTWRDATGCPDPSSAKNLIESMKAALRESNRVMLKELDNNIGEWQDATGRISPEAAKQYIDRLKGRLNKIHGYSVDW